MFLLSSTLIVLVIALGLYFRKQAQIHIPLMLTAFVADLSLVLIIEFQRKAVERVVDNVTSVPNAFLLFHVGVSLVVILLYIALIITGNKALKLTNRANSSTMQIHKILALIFIVFRLTNYITSFQMPLLVNSQGLF